MRLVTKVLATEPKLMADEEAFRSAYVGREYPRPAPVPAALKVAATVTRSTFQGRDVFTVTPRAAGSPWQVLYLHGGGYVDELLPVHWEIILQLVRHLGATVTVPLYPLAPEHDHRVGNDHVAAFYRDLVERVDPARLVLMGDSAGGGMALVQAMRARDAGLPLPARVVLFAPWVNVVPVNPQIAAIEPRDPVLAVPGGSLAGLWWAGADDPRDPDISPLFGDLAGLPPIDIFQGTADILWPDSLLVAERIREFGGVVNLYEYDDAIHVFVAATFTPEARAAYAQIAAALDSPQVSIGRGTQVVTNPSVMFSRALALRLVERSTPWINHIGARARVELASRHTRRTRRTRRPRNPLS